MNKHLKAAQYVTDLLENRFKFLGFKFGIDPILGIFPGAGDFVSAVLAFYLIWIAFRMQLPREVIREMVTNIVIDFLIGVIPLVGDFGDFIFKANTKNLQLLKTHSRFDVVDGSFT